MSNTDFTSSELADYRIAFVTCESSEQADKIATAIVEEKLAACVNKIGPIESTYHWEGKIEKGQEFLLMIKTGQTCLAQLETRIKALHSYTVPEFIALPIVAGSSDYLSWIGKSIHQ